MIRLVRRRERKRQLRINKSLKRRLFGHLVISSCYYCKKVFLVDNLTIEHLKPLLFGGTNSDDNIALACAPCNQEKGKEAWFQKRNLLKRNCL